MRDEGDRSYALLPRRAVIRGTALSTLVAATSVAAVGADATVPQGTIVFVANRRAMAAFPNPTAGSVLFLAEAGREGHFVCVEGRWPGKADPLQGLSVPAAAADFHYARIWDGKHGRPEWFGAILNEPAVDCADAIEACYDACALTELAQADYFIRRTLCFGRSGRTVRGGGRYALERGQGTRIILHRDAPGLHSADILLVGSIERPPPGTGSGEGDRLVCENQIGGFTLLRDGQCAPHPSGDLLRYPTGMRVSYVYHAHFRDIVTLESSVGFYIGGVVYTKFDDCLAQRKRPGTSAAGDFWVGYYLNGHIDFGYAGGNASLYMNRCAAADQHLSHVSPAGLRDAGAFVDTFLDHFETARLDTGIAFAVDGARGTGQTIDLHIRNPVCDGCGRFGIDLDLDATSSALVEITDPYISSGGPQSDRGILVHDGAGLVTITGGQVIGDFTGGSLWFSRTRGITVQGTKLHQASHPIVVTEASGLHLAPQINNYAKTSPAFAITCRALSRSIVRPTIIGADGPSFAGGISLGAETSFCEIDGSAIDPGCFTTVDAGNKVWFDGADARSGAAAARFARASNLLTGVTG